MRSCPKAWLDALKDTGKKKKRAWKITTSELSFFYPPLLLIADKGLKIFPYIVFMASDE